MEENLNNKPQRPTFLTVLCILTFIGSAFGVFSGITNVMSASTAAALMDPIKTEMDKEFNEAKEAISETETIMNEEPMTEGTSVDSLLDSSQIAEQASDFEKVVEDKVLGKVQETMGNALASINEDTIKNNGYAAIIASILTLIGAFFMWGLKKMGFLIYALGTLVGIVAPIIIYNGNIVGAISAIGIGFIGLIFIVLYALNRKHLVY